MKAAYSYQRFSSIKQNKGDSTSRQTGAAESFAKQFNLQLHQTFSDNGVSGFKGKNFSNESALSAFLKFVNSGEIEKGSCLIVENMDRLSRQSILPCLSKFIEIINSGVSIGVISQGKILDVKSITENPMELMLVLVEFARANNESATKSERVKSVIRKKLEAAKNGQKVWFAVQKPSWITALKNNKFILDDERVKTVQRIFNMYLSGESTNRIADKLNEDKVSTLRLFRDKKTNALKLWTNSTIAELLRNKNVIGWFGINGHEFNEYFPAIISEKDFLAVQAKLNQNIKNRGGSKHGLVRNLFKGILFCHKCGQMLETKTGSYKNSKGTLNHYAHYICRGVKNKSGCKNKGRIEVSHFEQRMFSTALNPNDFTKPRKETSEHLLTLETKLARSTMAISRFTKMLENDEISDMAELTASLARLNTERATLKKEVETEKAKSVSISNAPKVLRLIRDEIENSKESVSYIGENDEWVTEKIMRTTPEQMQDEAAQIKAYLQNTETRKRLRGMMPAVFKSISIQFGKDATVHFTRINGDDFYMKL